MEAYKIVKDDHGNTYKVRASEAHDFNIALNRTFDFGYGTSEWYAAVDTFNDRFGHYMVG
jgi:hypothetical protein